MNLNKFLSKKLKIDASDELYNAYINLCLIKKIDEGDLTIKDVLFNCPKQIKHRRYFDTFYESMKEYSSNQKVIEPFLPLSVMSMSEGFGKSPSKIKCSTSINEEVNISYFSAWDYKKAISNISVGDDIMSIGGKYSLYNGNHYINSPIIRTGDLSRLMKVYYFIPIYETTKKVTSSEIKNLVKHCINQYENESIDEFDDWIRGEVLMERNWFGFIKSIKILHCIDKIHTIIEWEDARDRLLFDELYAHQTILNQSRHKANVDFKREYKLEARHTQTSIEDVIYDKEFKFTSDQEKVIQDIKSDIESEYPMNRLLQGDVGTGKTMCGFAGMIEAFNYNLQSVFMCPTEVLAIQVYNEFHKKFPNLDIYTLLITASSMSNKKAREELNNRMCDKSKRAYFIFGTHAIIQKKVEFHNLGFAVIDEQHKFGVSQRAKLNEKANSKSINLLSMSATPIPRTLLMAGYGDIDISTLKELPMGKKEPNHQTTIIEKTPESIRKIAKRLSQVINDGKQAYWICPLIKENDAMLLKDVETRYDNFCNSVLFNAEDIGMIHGQMKSDEKVDIINRFKDNEIKLLVATTIIEVGIDIHNANIMIVENPERFGLSQLHQLRGRIGRGKQKGNFIILRTLDSTEVGDSRFSVMESTNDGFKVAEKDLELRGGGNLLTEEQKGFAEFSFGTISNTEFVDLAFQESNKIDYTSLDIETEMMINIYSHKYKGHFYGF